MISGEGKLFDLVRCESDEDWLAERRKGIGGSDVAAIMSLSAYSTPYQVWLEKTRGIHEDISDKPAVMWGNILEPVVGEHYMDCHPDRHVRRVNAIARSIQRPWAQASLDYEVHDPELGWGVLEIKTAGWRREQDWEDGVPVYYQTQVAHYLSVTGRPFADVAVLIAGQDYREFRVMRDEEDVAAVEAAVDEFWHDYVEKGEAPEVEAFDAHSLFMAHQSDDGEYLSGEDRNLGAIVNLWLTAKSDMDEARMRMDHYATALKDAIGDSSGLDFTTGRLTWQRSERKRLDSKRLRSERPDIADEYTTSSMADGGLRWKPRKEK